MIKITDKITFRLNIELKLVTELVLKINFFNKQLMTLFVFLFLT